MYGVLRLFSTCVYMKLLACRKNMCFPLLTFLRATGQRPENCMVMIHGVMFGKSCALQTCSPSIVYHRHPSSTCPRKPKRRY